MVDGTPEVGYTYQIARDATPTVGYTCPIVGDVTPTVGDPSPSVTLMSLQIIVFGTLRQ